MVSGDPPAGWVSSIFIYLGFSRKMIGIKGTNKDGKYK